MYLNANQVSGHDISMLRSDPRHLTGRLSNTNASQGSTVPVGEFGNLLLDSLNTVNEQQQTADALAVQAVINPESVDTHDVSIAAAKAQLSLSITKSVVDRVIQAYREIQNVR